MSLQDDLAAIAERAKAATPGAWRVGSPDPPYQVHHIGLDRETYGALNMTGRELAHGANAAFVAAARTDVPALVEMVRGLISDMRAHLAMQHPEAWDYSQARVEELWLAAKRKAGG